MRIGIDARLWSESGVGRYIRNLVLNLQILDRNNEYVLFVLNKDQKEILKRARPERGRRVQNDKHDGNGNFRIVRADIRWHTVEEQLRFASILNRKNLDLVHFPYFSVPVFYNKPFVVTIHDLILHHFPTGEASTLPLPFYKIKLLGYKFVISQAAKRARKIITVSNNTKKEIIDHLGVSSDKVAVTYEGVNNGISNIKHKKLKIHIKDQKYFLYVGNVYPHKNLERLFEAFSLLCHPEFISGSQTDEIPKRVRNDIRLVLVGREDYFYKRLKEKVKKMGFIRSVIFYGEVTDEELVQLYQNAKALVMPSLMEGFGLPALEAMANKCLVLASDIPALREICGDAAIYFDPYNVDDLYKKMKEIHSNNTYYYSDNIKRGVERVKMFSWEKMARETLTVYKKALGV